MKLGFGRVVPAPDVDDGTTAPRRAPAFRLPRGRVVGSDMVEAAERARAVLARAEARAAEIVERAEREVAELRLRAEEDARAEAAARVAAFALALSAREERALERDLDRVVALARVLAERLLGEALRLEPGRVVDLARRALDEARGARRVTLVAHPADAKLLEAALGSAKLGAGTSVVADAARKRGSLRLDTDVGVLDADLAPQLDRLLPKLRETLEHG